MASRRDRIVRVAHRILAEGGIDALTINRLSDEAQVALSTIYRGFQSKEGVVLATIVEHMRGIEEFLARSPTPKGDLDAVFSEYDWVVAELYRDPEYGRVVINFYFSSEADSVARSALRSVAHTRITAWLDAAHQAGQLVPGLDLERVARFQVDSEYVVYHKWARGIIPRERLASELKANFLVTAVAASRERSRRPLLDRLVALHAELHETS